MQDSEGMMLRFYVAEGARHDGVLTWEWLLQTARRLGLPGGTAVRAVGGFGRRHVVHESRFVELAGHETVIVEFVLDANGAQRLRAEVAANGLSPVAVQWSVNVCIFEPNVDGAA